MMSNISFVFISMVMIVQKNNAHYLMNPQGLSYAYNPYFLCSSLPCSHWLVLFLIVPIYGASHTNNPKWNKV